MEVGKSCLWEPGAACSPVGGGATSSLLPVHVPSCLSASQKQTSLGGSMASWTISLCADFLQREEPRFSPKLQGL